jgi:hypothetical protein
LSDVSSSSISLILPISFSSRQDKVKYLSFPQLKHVAVAGSIRVLRRVLVRGVARSRLGEARQRAVIPTLGIGILSTSFLVPAPVGVIVGF